MDRIIVSKVMKALVGECAYNWNGSYADMVILSGQDKPSKKDFTAKYNELNTAEPQELRELRAERDLLLQQTDWVVIKEREEGGSVSNFADWKKYRQELRDITKTYKSVEDVKWPTAPSE